MVEVSTDVNGCWLFCYPLEFWSRELAMLCVGWKDGK